MKPLIKIKIIVFLFFCVFCSFTYPQNDENPPTSLELVINNNTWTTVYVRMYPISMVFNGIKDGVGEDYNLEARQPEEHPPFHTWGFWWDYINGVGVEYYEKNVGNWVDEVRPSFTVYGYNHATFNHDLGAANTNGCFGYGTYKVEISQNPDFISCDSILIEQDYNTSSISDMTLNYGGPGSMVFLLGSCNVSKPINYQSEEGYFMKPWKLCGNNKTYHEFHYDLHCPKNIVPLDCRRDSYTKTAHLIQNHYFPVDWTWPVLPNTDMRQGNLTLYLTIDKPVETPPHDQLVIIPHPDTIKKFTNQISVTSGAILTISAGKTFTMVQYPTRAEFTMRIKGKPSVSEPPGVLKLLGNSQQGICTLRVKRNALLYLEKESAIRFYGGAKIIVESGGLICFSGADIRGYGSIQLQGLTVYCYEENGDYFFQDSTSLVLSDSAVWEIPSNKTVTFDGNVTSLNMGSNTEIKFGENSKIVFQNGARLIADHAKFTSADGNSTWDGIYLEDISNDTIANCTIENAVNGINITDKINPTREPVPTTEISNCTFSNTTNTQLTNGIYVNNSQNVLIKGNNFTSSQLAQGFANGIMIEYCAAGTPLVVDNNIDKVLTGIFVSQSSPYIARNTITGAAESGRGIELDNSNGTVKYNIVGNFVNSYATGYSSPYLLKNTFSGASESNIEIYANSIPILKAVNSGTTLSWLAGDNHITGYPTNAGIFHQDDSYPVMDSGFNIMNVNGSDYLKGDIPPSLDGRLDVTMNYWTDQPPVPQRFNVSGGEVIYEPAFDGSSYPPIDYYNLTDIGFGLYDTIFVESLGDNPGADNLFMQAYQSERNGQYLNAIYLYKQVITNYRNSSYATVSLSRIFNCLEKKLSSSNEYSLLQTYMNQLRTSNLYHRELRELAEDFVIKAKVKQGYLQSAINDYQNMYQQNQNNYKGIHALINKEILTAMLNDTNDTPSGGNSQLNLTNHKLRLLSIITGKNFEPVKAVNTSQIPHAYKLYQNYPNPFNPKTTIKYDLPKDGFVTFKVYDVLGKELYSVTEHKSAGTFQITLDGSNYASGLYFYRLEAGNYVETKKMVLIK
jgi:hypothetical protein